MASSEMGSAPGSNAELYAQREQRFNDVIALKKPDKIPLVPLVQHYFPTRIKGISNRDAGYDHKVRMDALRDATLEFGWDFAPPNGMAGHDGYEALATKQFRWPGGDLPDDAGSSSSRASTSRPTRSTPSWPTPTASP